MTSATMPNTEFLKQIGGEHARLAQHGLQPASQASATVENSIAR